MWLIRDCAQCKLAQVCFMRIYQPPSSKTTPWNAFVAVSPTRGTNTTDPADWRRFAPTTAVKDKKRKWRWNQTKWRHRGGFKSGSNMPQKLNLFQTGWNQTKAGPKSVKVLPQLPSKVKRENALWAMYYPHLPRVVDTWMAMKTHCELLILFQWNTLGLHCCHVEGWGKGVKGWGVGKWERGGLVKRLLLHPGVKWAKCSIIIHKMPSLCFYNFS